MSMPAPPPDTRAPGQAGHIADHNTIADSLTALESTVGALQQTVQQSQSNLPLNPTTVQTSAYTANPYDLVVCDVSGGGFTVKLPSAAANATRVGVKVINGTAGFLTVQCQGSDVLNKTGGSVSVSLLLLNQGATFQYESAVGIWYITADDLPIAQLDNRYAAGKHLVYADLLTGVDPTGASDSTGAIKFVQQVYGLTSPYQVVLGSGTYKIGTSGDLNTFGRGQGLAAPGSALCTINYVGSGTCINAWDSSFSSSLSTGGNFAGFTISGSGSGAGAVGFRWGDLLRGRGNDIKIANFTGAGSKGLYFHNVSGWSEEAVWTAINLSNNTTNVYFDTGSFDYSHYEFVTEVFSGQDGIRMENSAILASCYMEVLGNYLTGSGNTGAVIAMDRLNPGTGACQISRCTLNIGVETDGSTGTGHFTVLMLGGASSQLTGIGVMHFLSGTVPFQGGTFLSSFGFAGMVDEPVLGKMNNGDAIAFEGGAQWQQWGNATTNTLYAGMYIYPQSGDFQAFAVPAYSVTITGVQNEPFLRSRRMTLLFKQPSGGGGVTPTWPANWKFVGGSKTLSTAASAVDKIDLIYFPSEATWYAELVKAYS